MVLLGSLLKSAFPYTFKSTESSAKKTAEMSPEAKCAWDSIHKFLTVCDGFSTQTGIDLSPYLGNCRDLLKSDVFKDSPEASLLRITLAGNFSCGKSSMINDLLGYKVAPTDSGPSTRTITRITYGSELAFYNEAGKRISEAQYRKDVVSTESKDRQIYRVEVPSPFLKQILISDVPGFNAGTKAAIDNSISIKENHNADIIFFLCKLTEGTISQNVIDRLKGTEEEHGILEGIDGKPKKLYVILTMADITLDDSERENCKKYILNALKKAGIAYEDVFLYAAFSDDNAIKKEELEDEEIRLYESEQKRLKDKIQDIAKKNSDLVLRRRESDLKRIVMQFNAIRSTFEGRVHKSKRNWLYQYLDNKTNLSKEVVVYDREEHIKDFNNAMSIFYDMLTSAVESIRFCEVYKHEGILFDNFYIDNRSKYWPDEWNKKLVQIEAYVAEQPSSYAKYLKLAPSVRNPTFEILDTYNDDFFGNSRGPVDNECKRENKRIRQEWIDKIHADLSAKTANFESYANTLYDKKELAERDFLDAYNSLTKNL